MLPKTYQVRLTRPFGLCTHATYIFHIHAQDHHAALRWVARVFEGIVTRPTLHRWANPSPIPRVGNSDPVVITDCDAFRRSKRTAKGREFLPRIEGEFRYSEAAVAEDLKRVVRYLVEEQTQFRRSFQSLVRDYERRPVAWMYERLLEFKTQFERAEAWQASLEAEFAFLRQNLSLVMPVQLHAQAA